MPNTKQQPLRVPMEHDSYWHNVNNPEWQAEQRAKIAAQQAQRQADLAQARASEAQRQAEREKEQAEHQAFMQRVQAHREAFARGEIGPVDPAKVIPTLAAVFEPSKIAAQERAEAERRRINETARWPGLPWLERQRREKWEAVNRTTWPE